MPTGKIEIIEGARVVEQGGQVVEIDRIYSVSGLTGSSSTLLTALDGTGFMGAAIPLPGDVHPTEGDLMLEDRICDPLGPTTARIVLTYRWNPTSLQIIDTTSSVESVVTNMDSQEQNASPIVVSHPALPEDSNGNRVQGGEINVTTPRMTAAGIVTLPVENESAAIEHVARFTNTINSDNFILSADIDQWLCTNGTYKAVARTDGVVKRARFTFSFQHKPEGWNGILVVATRPWDGQPFPDSGSPDAPGTFVNWYKQETFASIGTAQQP